VHVGQVHLTGFKRLGRPMRLPNRSSGRTRHAPENGVDDPERSSTGRAFALRELRNISAVGRILQRKFFDQSVLTPANFTTLAHFSVSLVMSFPKSAGDPGMTVPPNSASRAFIAASGEGWRSLKDYVGALGNVRSGRADSRAMMARPTFCSSWMRKRTRRRLAKRRKCSRPTPER
jgi:hypothetical protein